MGDLLLGIDAGLTTTKAALFTTDGEEVSVGSQETPVERPAAGHREITLPDLWTTTKAAIRDAFVGVSVRPTDIAAIGVAGHGHGLYLLDGDGEQVRSAIKSTDSRATDLVEEWEADGTAETIRERLGYAPFAADPLSLLAWLGRHEPDTVDRIDRILFCKDYLKYRLTGRVCTDEMEASVFYTAGSDEYDAAVFDALDLAVGTDVLPDVVPSWKTCGRVTSDAATETGLTAGTPVASGLHDVGATALGTGAHRPGQGVLIVGTWGQSIVVTDDPYADEGDDGSNVDGTDGDETDDDPPGSTGLTRRYLDGYLRYKGLRSAATCLDWFVTEFGGEWRRRADAEAVSPYEIYDRVVADVPAGAEGLLFHPYLDGSTDAPTDRGGFYGLTSEHTKATMLRAVYEGVALSQAARLAELTQDTELTDVRLSGGGARSEVWSDIFASAVGNSLLVPAGEEAGARGAAVCGALAAGVYADHDSAVGRMVAVERRHDPDADVTALYRDRGETFEAALDAIRPTWKRLMADPESYLTND